VSKGGLALQDPGNGQQQDVNPTTAFCEGRGLLVNKRAGRKKTGRLFRAKQKKVPRQECQLENQGENRKKKGVTPVPTRSKEIWQGDGVTRAVVEVLGGCVHPATKKKKGKGTKMDWGKTLPIVPTPATNEKKARRQGGSPTKGQVWQKTRKADQ